MRIQVNYEDVRAAGSSLMSLAENYADEIRRIQGRVHELQGVWQGTDSEALIAQMDQVLPALLQMRDVTESYARHLQQAAAAYQNLQANRAASARML